MRNSFQSLLENFLCFLDVLVLQFLETSPIEPEVNVAFPIIFDFCGRLFHNSLRVDFSCFFVIQSLLFQPCKVEPIVVIVRLSLKLCLVKLSSFVVNFLLHFIFRTILLLKKNIVLFQFLLLFFWQFFNSCLVN